MKATLNPAKNPFIYVILLIPFSLFSQNPNSPVFRIYEDTELLVELLDIDPIEEDISFPLEEPEVLEYLQGVLSKYFVEEEEAYIGMKMSFPELKDKLDQNRFLSTYFGGEGHADNAPSGFESVNPETAASAPRAENGSTFPSTAIDGVGRFLAKRFKEEIYVAFFERFREQLAEEEILKGLFPQTLDILTYVDAYLYSGRIKMLGGAFQEDIDSLLFNVDRTVSSPTLRKRLKLDTKGYLAFKSIFFSFNLIKNPNPSLAIREYSSLPEWGEIDPNLASGMKLASIISESFQSQLSAWVGPEAITRIANDPIFRRVFLGLLYERVRPIQVFLPKSSPSELNFSNPGMELQPEYESLPLQNIFLDNFDQLVAGEINWVESGEELLDDALDSGQRIPASDGPPFIKKEAELRKVVVNSVRVFNDVVGFVSALNVSSDSKLKPLVNSLSDIHHFTQAVEDAAPYAVNFFSHVKSAIDSNKDSVASRNFQDKAYYLGLAFMDLSRMFGGFGSVLDTLEASGGGNKYFKTAEKIFYYGSFVSTVLTTDDAEDVSEIIERFALPSGSSRIKRESPLNISINAFAGPSFGWEAPSFSKLGFRNEVMLFTAPIGIAASTKLWKTQKGNGASLSLFLSAVDLGAITLFRLNDNNQFVSLPAAASFENIFAPGAHLILGFPDVPVSAGIGFQRSASLRKISQDEIRVDPSAKYRLGAFIGVDIPLLNIYTNTSYTFSRLKFKERRK